MDTRLRQQIEATLIARGSKTQSNGEIIFMCPVNGERDPRAYYNPAKGVWHCFRCGESGNDFHLARLLGIINNGHSPDGWQLTRQWNVGGHLHKRLDNGKEKQVVWDGGLGETGTANLPLYGIENITDASADVLVNEGEKSTDPLTALGFQAVGTACGAQTTPSRESLKPLAGHVGRVILCQDNDQPGRDHMGKIAARLKGMGKAAFILEQWPNVDEKGDAYDYVKAGHTADDVRAVLDTVKLYEGQPEVPEIIINGRQLPQVTADALQALYQSNTIPHIFRRSGALTRIGTDEKGRPFAETLIEDALRGKLARAAKFFRQTEKAGNVDVPPPLDVVRDVASLGVWDFPPLTGITESPVIRGNGTVLARPGYDRGTGLYYEPAPGLIVPAIPDAPSADQLAAAISLVCDVFCDFPYDSEASRAGTIAALISPILRPAIDGPVPLPVIDKPQAGTGATLIADGISIVATGRLAATMGMPVSEEEWEKKLSSHLLAGRSLCVIDNIEGKLYSDTLSRYLTSSQVSIRPLGRSADIILANTMTFLATGNNVTLGGDMPRRCFSIRLDAGEARPWLRKVSFKYPKLREWIAAERGSILAAILTIARAWMIAGRPTPEDLPILGGFESYCRTIGGILAFMGIKGFMANLAEMYDRMDKDTPEWEGFEAAWKEIIGEQPITAAQLIKTLSESDELAATLPDALAAREGKDYPRRVGNALRKRNGVRLPSGLMIRNAGTYKHAVTWQVVSCESQKTANSPQFSFKSELGELRQTPAYMGKENDSAYRGGGDSNSTNSPTESKTGELAKTEGSDGTENYAQPYTPCIDHSAALGMPVDAALDLWRSAGAPVIHLGQDVNCEDLAKFLSNKDVPAEHLAVISQQLVIWKAAANVPVLITAKMNARLLALGYSQDAINAMKPSEAWEKLNLKQEA